MGEIILVCQLGQGWHHGICVVLDPGQAAEKVAKSLMEFGGSLFQLEDRGSAKHNCEVGHGGGMQEAGKKGSDLC